MNYYLVDSGNQKKFERFGSISIIRPCSQAIWKPKHEKWDADVIFTRENGNEWTGSLPNFWIVEHEGLKFKLSPTDFGHLGIFPEHSFLWNWASKFVKKGSSVLNLFAYTGGATLALAKAGAQVCHVDASPAAVKWARENAQLNNLEEHPIRWIVDDVIKFLKREVRRKNLYDGIVLDPPSFGRGTNGEVFKIERDLPELLNLCTQLLKPNPLFLACSNHSNGMTPVVMHHLFEDALPGRIETGELLLKSTQGRDIPTGTYARWTE